MQTHQPHSAGPGSGAQQQHVQAGHRGRYGWLLIELAIDFAIMYLVMYAMIRSLDHFYLNINNVWMTLMMVAPMALVMMAAMRSMFPSRARNLLIIASAVVVFGVAYWGMRTQAAVGDEQFLRSMIPHHSGAILMCQEASISDQEIKELCREIVDSQRREIARMEAMLERR